MTYTRWTCEVQPSWRSEAEGSPPMCFQRQLEGVLHSRATGCPSLIYNTRVNPGLGLSCKLWRKFRIVAASGWRREGAKYSQRDKQRATVISVVFSFLELVMSDVPIILLFILFWCAEYFIKKKWAMLDGKVEGETERKKDVAKNGRQKEHDKKLGALGKTKRGSHKGRHLSSARENE